MIKSKLPELHIDVKNFIIRRLAIPPMSEFEKERLDEIRKDILERIKTYKEVKKRVIQEEENYKSFIEWVKESKIDLNTEENEKH